MCWFWIFVFLSFSYGYAGFSMSFLNCLLLLPLLYPIYRLEVCTLPIMIFSALTTFSELWTKIANFLSYIL